MRNLTQEKFLSSFTTYDSENLCPLLKKEGAEKNLEHKSQMLIPRGFTHGFSVLSESAILDYKGDELFFKKSEGDLSFEAPFSA